MQFNLSNINVNNVWRELLIISDTQPIPEFTNGVITQKQGDYETVYYTDGLYQSHQEDGVYYNWYLINSKVVKETGAETLKKEVAELKKDRANIARVTVGIQAKLAKAELGGKL